ncbi:B12-binding domain-containing radical SAM protein [Sinorhizobium meliloti]|uniref:B12-binding domain-containing radical SAM protein n=1 Tax=Rhizobium meliloti TaxID=382 RepID=UPI0018E8A9DF|nr:radical SAM protein [Sinorhizobium meliloti]QQF06282.1 B12-binding domain-containing radical SAM protein [Sinorhizobium meliloti]
MGGIVVLANSDIRYLLIQPPLTDPTGPYHSISYLVGHAESQGFSGYSVIDANIEALDWAAQPSNVRDLLQFADATIAETEAYEAPSRGAQMRYRIALASIGLHSESVQRAIDVFKQPDLFYSFPDYSEAADVLSRWQRLQNLHGRPGQSVNFRLDPYGPVNLRRVADLTETSYTRSLIEPFRGYFDGPFTDSVRRCEPAVVGLSIAFRTQLPFALHLATIIRRQFPNVIMCAGGTDVTNIVKNVRDSKLLWQLFRDFDALVVGEGESAFVSILRAVQAGGTLNEIHSPGILVRGTNSNQISSRYENVSALGSPNYRIWNRYGYWAPEQVLLYSPTRGCYWNRCTFCDYGLNDGMPTSPSRERAIDRVIADLNQIAQLTSAMYLAVDAISPSFLKKMCKVIQENRLNVIWSAEIRLDRSLRNWERAATLRKAGCVALSYGLESASQRVLDLIDKGIRIDEVASILQEMRRAGIASQMMCFTGFPTESFEEAQTTFQFLEAHSDLWSLAGSGEFTLTPGAIVAKEPTRFGVHDPVVPIGDDIPDHLLYRGADGAFVRSDRWRRRLSRNGQSIRRLELDRPFVGGIDTAHTILYAGRYGADWFASGQAAAEVEKRVGEPILEQAHASTPFWGFDGFGHEGEIELKKQEGFARGIAYGISEFDEWFSEQKDAERCKEHRLPLCINANGRATIKSVNWI